MKQWKHILLILALLVGVAATIHFYSDQPHATTINDAWLMSIERISPQGYVYSTFEDVRSNVFAGTAQYLNVSGEGTFQSGVTATNYALTQPEFVDIPMNYAWSAFGVSAPALVATTNNGIIQGLGFDNSDELFAQAQFPHAVATTNASFPHFYFEPHIHFDTIGTLDSTHSNVTWRLEWELGQINGKFNVRGTNQVTMGVTNNFTHYIASFGPITNDGPSEVSAVFRCRISRPASPLRDYSNSHDVLLDGLDVHVPVGNVSLVGTD